MKSIFDEPTEKERELFEKRNKLLDQQERLKNHHYRTETTVLADEDRQHDELQKQIDNLNTQIYS